MQTMSGSLQLVGLLPLIVVAGGSVAFLALSLLTKQIPRSFVSCGVCLGGLLAAVPYVIGRLDTTANIAPDGFSFFFFALILGGSYFSLLMSTEQLSRQRVRDSIDFDVMLLLAAFGGMVMVVASHLLVLFIGFEILSIAVYTLSGLARGEKASSEGALKYFLMGAFSSAFLVYGMALIFGASGSLNYAAISEYLASGSPSDMALVGFGLLFFGFAFKIALVPFHFWAPDAYQGAPVSVTAFMAVVVKAAAFGAFIRLLGGVFAPHVGGWEAVLWCVSVLSMTYGNLLAVRQKSVKRMLAYSSIAHAGYALLGLLVIGGQSGVAATVFYLLAYSVMTLGAFGVVLIVTAGRDFQYDRDHIDAFKGIGWKYPFLGISMAVFMFSLAGMPPLVGFVGKLYLFTSAVTEGFYVLVILAALNSLVSLYYYLRVLVSMFFESSSDETGEDSNAAELPAYGCFGSRVAIGFAVVATIYCGLFSSGAFAGATLAARSLGLGS